MTPAAGIGLGVFAVIWAGFALIGGAIATIYLGLGATMTHTLSGVFGDAPGLSFNWVVLLTALIGQLLGLIVSAIALMLGIRARRQKMRRGATAMTLGIIATSTFLVIGLFQLPLVSLFFEALAL
ncbi:MAG: hypothetical protein ACTHZX_09175 [Microbacterium sp.]